MNPETNVTPAPEQVTALTAALWLLLAAFGGAVKYISGVLRSSEIISNRRFFVLLFANVFISSFCGLMGGFLASTVTSEPTWNFVASGLFGYLGTTTMDWLVLALRKKIGIPVSAVVPVPPSVHSSAE